MFELIGSTPAPGLALAHVWLQEMPELWSYCLSCIMPVQPFAWTVVYRGKARREAAVRSDKRLACLDVRWDSDIQAGAPGPSAWTPLQAGMTLTSLPWPREILCLENIVIDLLELLLSKDPTIHPNIASACFRQSCVAQKWDSQACSAHAWRVSNAVAADT